MRRKADGRRVARGVTLIEAMVALAIVALLLSAAAPAYQGYRQRLAVNAAVADIARIRVALEQFRTRESRLPLNLAEANLDGIRDPWGRQYEYLSFSSGLPGIPGKRRKDRNLVPINTEFDLYSRGPDGESRPPLTARHSQDDIILARDGGYIGVAKDF